MNLEIIEFLPLSLIIVVFASSLFNLISNIVEHNKFSCFSVLSILLSCLVLFTDISFFVDNIYIFIGVIYLLELSSIIIRIIKVYRNKLLFNAIKSINKNDNADFYFALDKKDKMIDFSDSLIKLLGLDKKHIYKLHGWEVLFKVLNVVKINDLDITSSELSLFLNNLHNSYLNKVTYSFKAAIFNHSVLNDYTCIITPIFNNEHFVGQIVNFYQDKMALLKKLNENNELLTKMIVNDKNVLHTLMSLSEGVVLYYDYQEKKYYSTESFRNYLKGGSLTYTFEEFYYMISEDDRERYAEESKKIKSEIVNRILFKMCINDCLFYAAEDSMYLSDKGKELVSIIHITSRVEDGFDDGLLSTVDTEELLKKLANVKLTPSINRALKALDQVLEDRQND